MREKSEFDGDTARRLAFAFEAEETNGGMSPVMPAATPPGSELKTLCLSLAETLCDRGYGGPALVLAIAQLRKIDAERAHHVVEQSELERRAESSEQETKVRAARMQFALGELQFERSRMLGAGEKPPADLEKEIRSLEKQIADINRTLEDRIHDFEERAIQIALSNSTLEERAALALDGLLKLVDNHLDRGKSDATIVQLHGRLAGLRSRR
jgi:hypothetical protein